VESSTNSLRLGGIIPNGTEGSHCVLAARPATSRVLEALIRGHRQRGMASKARMIREIEFQRVEVQKIGFASSSAFSSEGDVALRARPM